MSKINLAVIGCGHWGKNLVRNFSELGALSAVMDSNQALAGSFASEYSIPVMDWPEIIADSANDAVAIATPAEQHEISSNSGPIDATRC